jgi:hypothetical protein
MPDLSDPNNKLEAIKMVQEFCKWMMLVQAGLLASYARWLTAGAIAPTRLAKAMTLAGFGGALVLASLRMGFLSDMAQRLNDSRYISELPISHSLGHIKMSMLGVPQHIFFFFGLVGFAMSVWHLRRTETDDKPRDENEAF